MLLVSVVVSQNPLALTSQCQECVRFGLSLIEASQQCEQRRCVKGFCGMIGSVISGNTNDCW